MVLHGTICFHMVPYGTIWYRMVPYGTIWYQIVPCGDAHTHTPTTCMMDPSLHIFVFCVLFLIWHRSPSLALCFLLCFSVHCAPSLVGKCIIPVATCVLWLYSDQNAINVSTWVVLCCFYLEIEWKHIWYHKVPYGMYHMVCTR